MRVFQGSSSRELIVKVFGLECSSTSKGVQRADDLPDVIDRNAAGASIVPNIGDSADALGNSRTTTSPLLRSGQHKSPVSAVRPFLTFLQVQWDAPSEVQALPFLPWDIGPHVPGIRFRNQTILHNVVD